MSISKNSLVYISILALSGFVLILPATFAHAGEIVAIVNKANNAGDLSAKDVQTIYEGKRKNWDNGEVIGLLLPPSNSEAMKVLAEKIFKFGGEADVSKFYLKAVFQQKFSTPPKSVTSANDAATEVAVSPGAIAIVDAAEISDKGKVKILKISGL